MAADLAPGAHRLAARAELGDEGSALGEGLVVAVEPDALVRPEGVAMRQDLDGQAFVQPYQDASGCALLAGDGAWQIHAHPGAPIRIEAPVSCPGGSAPEAVLRYGDANHPMAPAAGGVLSAELELGDGGPVALEARCGERTHEVVLGTVNVAFDGFVHAAPAGGGFGERVAGATVTLFRFDPGIENYRQWNGEAWFGQRNPQVTGAAGWYAFYPPPGRYLARVEAAGYETTLTPALELRGEPFLVTVGLTRTGGFVPTSRVFLPVGTR